MQFQTPVARPTVLFLLLSILAGCAAAPDRARRPGQEQEAAGAERAALDRTLDAFHEAAARADGEAYFTRLTPGSIYLGTDATERWTLDDFRGFAEPYFASGRGWTYTPFERHVWLDGAVAWFDERLWNEKYGECRGTGVLRNLDGSWRIAHYNLSFPIPNDIAAEVTGRIQTLVPAPEALR